MGETGQDTTCPWCKGPCKATWDGDDRKYRSTAAEQLAKVKERSGKMLKAMMLAFAKADLSKDDTDNLLKHWEQFDPSDDVPFECVNEMRDDLFGIVFSMSKQLANNKLQGDDSDE